MSGLLAVWVSPLQSYFREEECLDHLLEEYPHLIVTGCFELPIKKTIYQLIANPSLGCSHLNGLSAENIIFFLSNKSLVMFY